jgi:DNA-binding response OmpR family regulator
MHVLIVEDDRDISDTLQMGLEETGFRVDVAHDGLDGEVKARTSEYDLLVVDWMLPGQDGPRLIRRLREAERDVPVLMLTARAENADQIEALATGADDYLSKPFSFEVLVARLHALARRAHAAGRDEGCLELGPLRVDLRARRSWVGDEPLDLREKEFRLLSLFAERADQVVTRTTLAEQVWDDLFVSDDVLNTTVGSLRRTLHRATQRAGLEAPRIETLRRVGYRLATA